MTSILIFGGTFDPPHFGHLKTAQTIQQQLQFEHFIFLPCKIPVLKAKAQASSEQRIEMLKLALEKYPAFEIDTREITRETPSYMVETLQSFRQTLGDAASISLCMGMDSFLTLPQWHQWKKILTLSHLLIIERPAITVPYDKALLKNLLLEHEVSNKNDLFNLAHGNIYRFDAGHYDISSRWLRRQVQLGFSIEPYLPAAVYQYIKSQVLYL